MSRALMTDIHFVYYIQPSFGRGLLVTTNEQCGWVHSATMGPQRRAEVWFSTEKTI